MWMRQELLLELKKLTTALASKLPGNLANPANSRLADSLRDSLAEYFAELEKGFPYAELEKAYEQNVREAGPVKPRNPLYDDWLDPLLKAFRADLLYRVNSHMATAYLSGSVQMTSYGATKLGIPIAFEGPPVRQAIDWARDYSSKLVTKVDEETKNRIAQIISDGIDNKRGIDGIARDIKADFADMGRIDEMGKTRATMIARTETNSALSTASMDRMHDMGVDGKQWICDFEACELCMANANEGVIPIDQEFASGVMNSPQHPRCECAISPAMLSNSTNKQLD
jgi:hypothetical protein